MNSMQKWSLWAAGMVLVFAGFPFHSYENEATDIMLSRLAQNRKADYHDCIIEAGKRHEMDPALIKAITMPNLDTTLGSYPDAAPRG